MAGTEEVNEQKHQSQANPPVLRVTVFTSKLAHPAPSRKGGPLTSANFALGASARAGPYLREEVLALGTG